MGNRRKKYTEEQITQILKEAEDSNNLSDTLRKYGVNDSSYYRWKAKYGGMDSNSIQRLRELELEKWREKYNNERPHSALNYEPPSNRRRPHGVDTNRFNIENEKIVVVCACVDFACGLDVCRRLQSRAFGKKRRILVV